MNLREQICGNKPGVSWDAGFSCLRGTKGAARRRVVADANLQLRPRVTLLQVSLNRRTLYVRAMRLGFIDPAAYTRIAPVVTAIRRETWYDGARDHLRRRLMTSLIAA